MGKKLQEEEIIHNIIVKKDIEGLKKVGDNQKNYCHNQNIYCEKKNTTHSQKLFQ